MQRVSDSQSEARNISRAKINSGDEQTTKRVHVGKGPQSQSNVYNRLYQCETASSASRRRGGHESTCTHNDMRTQKSAAKSTHSKNTRKAKIPAKEKESDEPKNAIHAQQRIPINMNIQYRTKSEKKEGRPYSKHILTQTEVRRAVNGYESGDISSKTLAYAIIDALFYKDFMPGEHWDIDGANIGEITAVEPANDGEPVDVQVFAAEKQATWDWKDIYSIASAKATIKISRASGNIYVDDYSYYVAG